MVEDALQLVYAVLAEAAGLGMIEGAAQLGTIRIVLAHGSRSRGCNRSRYRLVVLHWDDVRGCKLKKFVSL